MRATLFVIPGSHPSRAAQLMLDHKGIPYRRRDLIPLMSRAVLRAARFPGTRVPALRIDGRRISGSTAVSRALDEIRPDPPLFPTDPVARARVEAAEAWGDEFQQSPRTILWWCLRKDGGPLRSYSEGARLGIPLGLAMRTAPPMVAMTARLNESNAETVKGLLADLPGALDRIDGWIADGTLGGASPNAADFQIAPSVRLLMTMDDLRPFIETRPAGHHALRIVPDYKGRVPPILPDAWLAPLRG